MPHEEDDWDLNSPGRVRDALGHQPERATGWPQAESAVSAGANPARVPTSLENPDGRVPYA